PAGRLTQIPCPANLAYVRAIGSRDRARQSDTGATERALRRRVRRAHHSAGVGIETARPTHFRGVAGSLADVAELRGELLFHRRRLGQSPLLDALCQRGYATPHVVQFRAFVFDIVASFLYCLDGSERARVATGGLLRGRLLPGERDLCRADLGAHRSEVR